MSENTKSDKKFWLALATLGFFRPNNSQSSETLSTVFVSNSKKSKRYFPIDF